MNPPVFGLLTIPIKNTSVSQKGVVEQTHWYLTNVSVFKTKIKKIRFFEPEKMFFGNTAKKIGLTWPIFRLKRKLWTLRIPNFSSMCAGEDAVNSRCGDGLGFCKASNVAGKPPICTLCGVGTDETQFECCPGVIQWPSSSSVLKTKRILFLDTLIQKICFRW